MWEFSTYFKDEKVLEYALSWFSIESNRLQPEHYFPPNIEPKSKYYLDKYFGNSID